MDCFANINAQIDAIALESYLGTLKVESSKLHSQLLGQCVDTEDACARLEAGIAQARDVAYRTCIEAAQCATQEINQLSFNNPHIRSKTRAALDHVKVTIRNKRAEHSPPAVDLSVYVATGLPGLDTVEQCMVRVVEYAVTLHLHQEKAQNVSDVSQLLANDGCFIFELCRYLGHTLVLDGQKCARLTRYFAECPYDEAVSRDELGCVLQQATMCAIEDVSRAIDCIFELMRAYPRWDRPIKLWPPQILTTANAKCAETHSAALFNWLIHPLENDLDQ